MNFTIYYFIFYQRNSVLSLMLKFYTLGDKEQTNIKIINEKSLPF